MSIKPTIIQLQLLEYNLPLLHFINLQDILIYIRIIYSKSHDIYCVFQQVNYKDLAGQCNCIYSEVVNDEGFQRSDVRELVGDLAVFEGGVYELYMRDIPEGLDMEQTVLDG